MKASFDNEIYLKMKWREALTTNSISNPIIKEKYVKRLEEEVQQNDQITFNDNILYYNQCPLCENLSHRDLMNFKIEWKKNFKKNQSA